jgi:hypothetical protein
MNQKRLSSDADQDYALLVLLTQKPPAVLLNLVHLVMHYQFGLEILIAHEADEVSPMLLEYDKSIRCVLTIHDRQIEDRNQILVMNRRGRIPLFLLLPASLLPPYEALCEGLKNTFLCSWESLFSKTESSFQQRARTALQDYDIKGLLDNAAKMPHIELQKRVHGRMKHLNVFPTLPEIVLRLARLLKNPRSTIKDLEEVLIGDPAIVHKLLQVINTPIFAGAGHKGSWTLKEAIVRLGLKKWG